MLHLGNAKATKADIQTDRIRDEAVPAATADTETISDS